MRVRINDRTIAVELGLAEARVLLDELLDVPGGSHRPKIRQLCKSIETVFRLHGGYFDSAGEEEEAQLRRRKTS